MNRILNTFAVGAVLFGVTLGGCGGGAQPPSSEKVNAAVSASARELDTENQNEQDHDLMVSRFMTVLNQLRALPALAPLFDQYQVPDPIVIGDDDLSAGLIDLLHAVRITVVSGTVTITNRETRAEIFSGPLSDLASGVFHPENLPGGTPSALHVRLLGVGRLPADQHAVPHRRLGHRPPAAPAARRSSRRPARTSRRPSTTLHRVHLLGLEHLPVEQHADAHGA